MNKKDKKSKNLIKKFLVASAAVSGLVTISGSAMADVITENQNNAETKTAAHWNPNKAAANGDTLKFGDAGHAILVDSDLSGGVIFDLNSTIAFGGNYLAKINDGGKLKISSVLNYSPKRAAANKTLNITFNHNDANRQLILAGDLSDGQLGVIDLANKGNSQVIIEDGAKLDLLALKSNGGGGGIVSAKGDFYLKTRDFGDGSAITKFKLFDGAPAGKKGEIEFDLANKGGAGVAGDINADNPMEFQANGDLTLRATGANNKVELTGVLDINDKTATITFTGTANNGANVHTAFDAANFIKNAKGASFIIDMDNANALVNFGTVTNASFLNNDTNATAQKLTIKKGIINVSAAAKFAKVTFEGSEKANGTLALAGAPDAVHTIKLDEASPKNTGVLEVFRQNQSLDKDSTIFAEKSPGIYELYFSSDNTLTLTKESNNINTLYITSKDGQDNTGTLKLVGGATLGSAAAADSYIGYYPDANGVVKVDTRIKGITLETQKATNEMVFNQKKIRIGDFNAMAGNSGITANHANKSSSWTFSASDIRTHFNVAANSNATVTLNNQDDTGVTLAGTWGVGNALTEFVINTKGDVKLDNSSKAIDADNAGGGAENTAISTKKLTFQSDVNLIGSDTVFGKNVANAADFSGLQAISANNNGGIIIASSATAYDPNNSNTATYGTVITAANVKKLVEGKVARLGITGEADANIATNGKAIAAIKINDLDAFDASSLKLVTLKNNKGAAVIEGKAKIGDIGSTEFNFAEVRFLGANEATYTNNVFGKAVVINVAKDLTFNGDIHNQDAMAITGDKTVAFGGNVGDVLKSTAELTFNGKDKTIGNLGKVSTTAEPNNYIQQKVNFTSGSANVGNVYAKTLNVKDYEFKISEAKEMYANDSSTQENVTYTFDDSNSSLRLTAAADKKHVYSKALTLNLKRSNETTQSKIILNDPTSVNLDSVNTIIINLDATDDNATADVASKSIVFIETSNGADTSKLVDKLKIAKFNPINPNRFRGYERDGLSIVSKALSVKEAANKLYEDLKNDSKISNTDAEMVKAYVDSFEGGSASSSFARFLQRIGSNRTTENKNIVAFIKNTSDVAKDTYNVVSSVNSTTSRIADSLGERMSSVSMSSSGDESPVSSVGAYLQPFMSFADNSADGNKYSLSGGGFTIGGDVGLNENNTIVGLAYTFASNKLKFKNSATDTTNASTNAFSIYANQKIASGAFIEGLFAYASTDARANMNRASGLDAKGELTYKSIKNDYNIKTIIGRALVGYNYTMNSFMVSPFVGAEFVSSKTKDGNLFKEKDLAVNTSIKAKDTTNPSVLLGARFATEIDSDDMKIIPTAGLLMKFKLSDKDMEVDQTLDGFKGAYVYKKNKLSKFSVVPSVGVTVKQNQMEYSASYAADISEKYLGHNAGLKVKINF